MNPVLLVVAGPNGAGKTTVTARLRDEHWSKGASEDGVDARLCVRTQEGSIRKVYGPLPEWVRGATRDFAQHPAFVDLRGRS